MRTLGQADSVTPTLDSLMYDGIKMSRFHTLHLCTPARSSFLTGKYPLRLGTQHSVIQPTGK